MFNNILAIDTETTGLNSTTDKIIEIAAILYNVPSRTILTQVSCLYPSNENNAFAINKIPVESLNAIRSGNIQDDMDNIFLGLMEEADIIMAHNAEFDKRFIEAKEDCFSEASESAIWVCSKSDINWNLPPGSALNLIHIAASMDVPVINAHRALSDCSMLIQCINKLPDIQTTLENALLPRSWYRAHISYDRREEAKERGFTWNADKKIWIKRMTHEEASSMSFEITLSEIDNKVTYS